MGTIEMMRQDAPAEAAAPVDLAARLAGLPADERVVELLAFALATAAGPVVTAAGIAGQRQAAVAQLSEHAFRYLHNTIDQIRRDAVAEQLGTLRQPPGFVRLVLANLLALGLAGLVAGYLAMNPAILAGLAGLLAG